MAVDWAANDPFQGLVVVPNIPVDLDRSATGLAGRKVQPVSSDPDFKVPVSGYHV